MYSLSRFTLGIVTSTVFLSAGISFPSQAQMPNQSNNNLQQGVTLAQDSNTSTQVYGNSTNLELMYDNLTALNRAKNLARMAAERVNGYINNYRAEPSMHGAAEDSPFVDNGNGTWTFNFTGTRPGSSTPAFRTVVTVSKDGQTVTVDENTLL